MLKEYGALLAEDPSWAQRARQFSEKVKDLSEWLVATGSEVFDSTNPDRGALKPGMKVTYQDACHLAHAQRIAQAPRELVKTVIAQYGADVVASRSAGEAFTLITTTPERTTAAA